MELKTLNDYILQNPKMKLREIAIKYGITPSAVSRRRSALGIKHEAKDICKQILTLLHLRNKDIAFQLGCSETLVAHIRFKEKKSPSNLRVELNDKQVKIVKENYNKLSIPKLSEKIGVTTHVLRSRMIEMKLHNDIDDTQRFYDYDLDNGKGYFDLEKYKKIMF
jgi:DNA-binding Lrp family transcriptional regulator